MSKKLILFGAGNNGIEALALYGREKVAFFCDNDETKIGTKILGISVLSFVEMLDIYDTNNHIIIVTPDNNVFLTGMLELRGIDEYILYKKNTSFNTINAQRIDEVRYYDQNVFLEQFAQKSLKMDLIENGFSLKEDAREVLRRSKEGACLLHYGIGAEGNFYGNLETLLEYAEYDDFDRIYAPNVSHNGLKPSRTTETMFDTAAIVSGKYFQEKIHKWKPYVPVFTVGPYIQYATGVYDLEKVRTFKNSNGRTLTVFLPHAIENISRFYSKMDFIDDVIGTYKKQFDTINLCVYWADITEECCEYAAEKGMKIITAGFRFDPLFTKRLRTIFDISDAVAGGDLGTHFMYALALDIPISRININDNTSIYDIEYKDEMKKSVQLNKTYKDFENLYFDFVRTDFECTNRQKEWLLPYAGFGIKRSKEYMHTIFDVAKDILIICDGMLDDYPEAVRTAYKMYIDNFEFEKLEVLVNATGNYSYYK